jgi:ubiquinone/menaquinone biosynthesis C-methylase UbiE
MLPRVLEPEVMDTPDDARDYDAMDHAAVNRAFAADFLSACPSPTGPVLDVGTGTALIPIELCRQSPDLEVVAIDMAEHMLALAAKNVAAAGLSARIRLERANGRRLGYPSGSFAAVVSNSIVHHIPDPFDCFSEMARVCRAGGTLFVRDLVRPATEEQLEHLVTAYAGDANAHQRRLFADSLRAALTLSEVQSLVGQLGFSPHTVRQTSDRHWTFVSTQPV